MGHPHRNLVAAEAGERSPLVDRLVFWKSDLHALTGKSTRTIDRWISSGEFPKPDAHISGKPVWKRQTIQDWSCGG